MMMFSSIVMCVILLLYFHWFDWHKVIICASIALVYGVLLVLLINMVIESIPEMMHLNFIQASMMIHSGLEISIPYATYNLC